MTTSNQVGRPLKFERVEQTETQRNLYFDDCDKREAARQLARETFLGLELFVVESRLTIRGLRQAMLSVG